LRSIAVVGPGAIGGTLAAWLAQDPANAVTVCVRSPFDGLVIETPGGRISAAPRMLTSPAEAASVDWVLVTTKTYDAPAAAAWLDGLVGADTRVAVIQNGVEHLSRFPQVPVGRTVPVIIDLPVERTAPGRIRQRRDGMMVVPQGPSGADFAQLFAATPITVSATDDFTTAAWRKLCLNCAGAVSALVLKPGGVVRLEPMAAIMRGLVAECVAVGRAEGAHLGDEVVEAILDGYRDGPPDSVNSMHADRLAGRPMEIDARNGVIVRRGAAHGLATPLNALMADLLTAAQ
jgi:2-dehydropantoate 2-reductase